MPDVRTLLTHWGYAALFLGVLVGNLGIPVPETCLLWVAGVLVWQHHFSLGAVLGVGVVAAVVGDNAGYWVGRRYGQPAVARFGARIGLPPARIAKARAVLARYGAVGVFGARFFTGLRCLAGPLAGSGGLPPLPFFLANVLGALIYVPLTVAEGYAVGYGVGGTVTRFHRELVPLKPLLLLGVLLGLLLLLLGWRIRQRRQTRRRLAQAGVRLEAETP